MGTGLRFAALAACAASAAVVGVGAGGAANERIPCVVEAPGFPTASGTGRVTAAPSGNLNFTCQAQLPAGAAPPQAVQIAGDPCSIVVSASGRVVAGCHVR